MKLAVALNRSTNRLFTSPTPTPTPTPIRTPTPSASSFFLPFYTPPVKALIPFQTSKFSPKFSSSKSTRPLFRFYRSTMVANSSFQPPVHVKDRIDLTATEKQIFDRFLQVLHHFNLQTQLRVAGGWVRDKLLGKECYDIDIALDNMLGKEFCETVNNFLSSTGEDTQRFAVIECNPDQSKHLETARMCLFDVWIDFVNLRSEDYSESSRIPTMRFGTPEEDAYRRDLTINSLFYNINNDSVEDFTGRGIADLKSGKIVTPLSPKQTFLDDPLRVLRAIRFGARFNFALDEELKKAASDDDVKAAIADKISRERIGHEIDLMISGNQPAEAMAYVSELQLFWAVFSLPSEFEPSIYDGYDRVCVADVGSAWGLLQTVGCSFNADQQRLCLYAALFLAFREIVYKDKKGKKIPVVSHIICNSLKLKSKDAELVIRLHIAAQKFVSLIPFMVSKDAIQSLEVDWKSETIDVCVASKLRILAGLLLRDSKGFWRVALLLSMLLYPKDIDSHTNSSELNKRTELYKMVEDAILKQDVEFAFSEDAGLEKVWEVKALLDGKEIMNVLELKTSGPLVGEWQQKVIEWQLAHPFGTKEECKCWMMETCSKRARIE